MKNTMTTKPMFLEWVVINNRTGAKQAFRCPYNPKTGTTDYLPISSEEATSLNDHGKETAD